MRRMKWFGYGFAAGIVALVGAVFAVVLVDEATKRRSARSYQDWHGRLYR